VAGSTFRPERPVNITNVLVLRACYRCVECASTGRARIALSQRLSCVVTQPFLSCHQHVTMSPERFRPGPATMNIRHAAALECPRPPWHGERRRACSARVVPPGQDCRSAGRQSTVREAQPLDATDESAAVLSTVREHDRTDLQHRVREFGVQPPCRPTSRTPSSVGETAASRTSLEVLMKS